MTGPKVTLKLDDDAPFVRIVEALTAAGCNVSNVDGFTFRVRWLGEKPKVNSRARRHQPTPRSW